MNRVGQPVDIARVVCFLASQDGEWVNGKVIGIDGAVSKISPIYQDVTKLTEIPGLHVMLDSRREFAFRCYPCDHVIISL